VVHKFGLPNDKGASYTSEPAEKFHLLKSTDNYLRAKGLLDENAVLEFILESLRFNIL